MTRFVRDVNDKDSADTHWMKPVHHPPPLSCPPAPQERRKKAGDWRDREVGGEGGRKETEAEKGWGERQ